MQNNLGRLNNIKTNNYVLGCLTKNPRLLVDKTYPIAEEDFHNPFQQVWFGVITNLIYNGVREITLVEISDYLAAHPKQERIFNENGGKEVVHAMLRMAQTDNFEYYYNRMRKFALLRDLVRENIDIRHIYDTTVQEPEAIEEQEKKLDAIELSEIFKLYDQRIIALKGKYLNSADQDGCFHAADGLWELKESYKIAPSFGKGFINPAITGLVRGMRKRKLMLFSASSGLGKSRVQMANACKVAVPKIYDTQKNEWVDNPDGNGKALYITTELEKHEVQTVFIAYLSGVNEEHILNGMYEDGEEERVDEAIRILLNSPLYCKHIADFDAQDIEVIIEDHIVKYGIEYVFYDYLHTTPKMLTYYNKRTGTGLNEHQVLYLFGNTLKQIANKYDIFIYTSTQLNRGYKDNGELDATVIRGAMALADKIDVGCIVTQPTQKELKMLEEVLLLTGNGLNPPNVCYTIYKNRGNKHKNIRVWCRINLGTVREEVLFATDNDFNLKVVECVQTI